MQASESLRNIVVYRKGDIVTQPMKKGSFVQKNVPGVGWGGSCRGVLGHVGVGWLLQGWDGSSCMMGWVMQGSVGHAGVGWGESCRGGVGHAGVGWVM